MQLIDSNGRRIAIEGERFRGGEGTVHPVVGDPTLFAKLYHRPIDPKKQTKLTAMTGSAQPALLRVAAWPSATLHEAVSRRMVGLLMPRFDGERFELHQLYNPATRKQFFRHADWGFLVQAARNVAAAVDTVHAAGHVIGDVNQRNFIVGRDATVKVLDCDSFQIRGADRVHRCEVGMPEFTPPELQNRVLADFERTPNHDAFGLAVLCFQLLFMGRHPFIGRFLGSGDMPVERAIAERRFAFGRDARARLMEPPPNMLPFDALPPRLGALFDAAFGGGAVRPAAGEWMRALETAQRELRACTVEPMHKFYRALPHCAWCTLEAGSGVFFFIGVVATQAATFDFAKLWGDITLTTNLSYEEPRRPIVHAIPTPVALSVAPRRKAARVTKVVAVILCIVAIGLLPEGFFLLAAAIVAAVLWPMPGAKERHRRVAELRAAERAWQEALARCTREVSIEPLKTARVELEKLATAYRALDGEKQAEIGRLVAGARDLQLTHYLERQLLRGAGIPGIGPQRVATLSVYGIDTAADVTWPALARIVGQGFGPALKTRVMAWRHTCESQFVFDSKRAVPQSDLDALEYRFRRRRADLEQRLRAGAEGARRVRAAILQRRTAVSRELEAPARVWAQAKADVDAIEEAFA